MPFERCRRVYISYTNRDERVRQFAGHLWSALVTAKDDFEVFLDVKSIDVGTEWKHKVEDAISQCDVFLCLFSRSSPSTYWTMNELNIAFQKERVVLPVFFDFPTVHKEEEGGLTKVISVCAEESYSVSGNKEKGQVVEHLQKENIQRQLMNIAGVVPRNGELDADLVERLKNELSRLLKARDQRKPTLIHYDGGILEIGGYENETGYLSTVTLYDTSKIGTRNILPARMISSRANAAVAVINHILYVFGGENDDGVLVSSEELDLNAPEKGFRFLPSPLPAKLCGMTAVRCEERILLVGGGMINPPNLGILQYANGAFQWLAQSVFQLARMNPLVQIRRSLLYVAGGGQPGIEAFDLENQRVAGPVQLADRLIYSLEQSLLAVIARDGEGNSYELPKTVVAVNNQAWHIEFRAVRLGVNRLFTTMLTENGSNREVGPLMRPADFSVRRRSRRRAPLVFLCHHGDDSKKQICEPTRWFLDRFGIECFLDVHSLSPWQDGLRDATVINAAYYCTDALVLLSPNFRQRKYPVEELNTFAVRWNQENVNLLLALWRIDNLDGYNENLEQSIWLPSAHHDADHYMTAVLWPQLKQEFELDIANDVSFEQLLGEYREGNPVV